MFLYTNCTRRLGSSTSSHLADGPWSAIHGSTRFFYHVLNGLPHLHALLSTPCSFSPISISPSPANHRPNPNFPHSTYFSAVSLLIGFGVWWWCFSGANNRRGYGLGTVCDGNWVGRLRPQKLVQVTLFQKPLVKVRLGDLLAATDHFSQESVIFVNTTGVMYKAVLARGLAWLHYGNQPPCLHQNLSSSSILIDEDFDARIIDFGLARLMSCFLFSGSCKIFQG
ncbi:hypothetical protein Droror1_Dr00020165 [Drosera rotundifolia]